MSTLTVHAGTPNSCDNLCYRSKTELTKQKLEEGLIADGLVVEGCEDVVRNTADWYNDLMSTSLLLRKQLFKRPLFTTAN